MPAEHLTERALTAAQNVARAHGVPCDHAAVLAAGSNVLVHLRPAPLVARVMTGTAALHADVASWLAREVAVGAFLADRGLAVPPAAELPPGPHHQDGLWLTFWAYVQHDASQPATAAELGTALRHLHVALAGYAGDLPPLRGIGDWLQSLVAELRASSPLARSDLDRLDARLREVAPSVFESALPAQAIHGDAAAGNLLRSQGGLLWNDLEDVCVGPVHWDLAGLVAELRGKARSDEQVAELLDAYGEIARDELAPFVEAHGLYAAIWRSYSARRG